MPARPTPSPDARSQELVARELGLGIKNASTVLSTKTLGTESAPLFVSFASSGIEQRGSCDNVTAAGTVVAGHLD